MHFCILHQTFDVADAAYRWLCDSTHPHSHVKALIIRHSFEIKLIHFAGPVFIII